MGDFSSYTGMGKKQTGGHNPTTAYLTGKTGGGKSSIVAKGAGDGSLFIGGPKDGDKDIGTKRFDLGKRSLNRGRGM